MFLHNIEIHIYGTQISVDNGQSNGSDKTVVVIVDVVLLSTKSL